MFIYLIGNEYVDDMKSYGFTMLDHYIGGSAGELFVFLVPDELKGNLNSLPGLESAKFVYDNTLRF